MSVSARRDLLTVALAVAAGAHAALVQEHWQERHLLGAGFLLATACLAGVAVWLQLASRPQWPAVLCLPLLGALVALFLLTRTTGLPVVGLEEWGVVGAATQLFELAGLALALSLVKPIFPLRLPNRKGVLHAQRA